MRNKTIAAAVAAAVTTTAYAGEISPTDVVFGEHGEVSASLTGVAGDPVAGKKAFLNRKQGNCLACHANSDASDHSFHGEVGPTLDGAGDRWEEAELRGILVNSKKTFEGTIMPSFYRLENGVRPLKNFDGKSVLTAQQVEDILAYVSTLKE